MKISTRATLSNTIAMSLVLIIFCLVTIYFFKKSLTTEFDRTLGERHAYLQRHFEVNNDGSIYFRGSEKPNYVQIKGVKDKAYVEVLDENKKIVFKNSKIELLTTSINAIHSISGKTRLRMIIKPIKKNGKIYYIKAAFEENRLQEKVLQLLSLFLILIPFAIVTIGSLNYWLSKKSLAPIFSIVKEAKGISAKNLNKRLKVSNNDSETEELTVVLNDLLSRIDSSFTSLKQFTADASHELRTPIAAIRSMCEVSIQSPKSSEQQRETIISVLDEIKRMTQLIESLLMLAKGDAGFLKLNKTSFDIMISVKEVAELLSVLADEKKQKINFIGERQLFEGDPVLLRQAIMGLLHNAINYSPEESAIEILVVKADRSLIISIKDEGPGIPIEMRPQIFDRFFRVDKSRTRQGGGVGLGLSIVKWISEMHEGDVSYSEGTQGGAHFSINLPII